MAKARKSESEHRRELRRLQHQDLSRNQLLDAAEEVFGRKGFHETTLKEVADLAGFSVGSVYSFFESKDDLFNQIFLRRGAQFMDGMHELLADDSVPPLEQLVQLAEFQVGFFRAHRHFARVYLRYATIAQLAAQNDQVDEAVTRRYHEAMQMQADIFRRGQKTGELRDGDPYVLSRLFSGIVASYQSIDPVVVSDDEDAHEHFPLADLQALIARAFAP